MSASVTRRCREALAVAGIYQRLGVPSDRIYFKPTKGDDGSFHPAVVADVAGKYVEWQIPIYGGAATVSLLLAEWSMACEYWNILSNDARAVLVDESEVHREAPCFIATCALSGLSFHADRQPELAL